MWKKGDLAKLAAEDRAGIGLLLEAWVWLAVMAIAIRLAPFRVIVRALHLAETRNDTAAAPPSCESAHRIGRALSVAADRAPWLSTCLCRALAGMVLLTRRGLPGVLHLGVAVNKTAPGAVQAHAWLNIGDTSITGGEISGTFTPLTTFAKET